MINGKTLVIREDVVRDFISLNLHIHPNDFIVINGAQGVERLMDSLDAIHKAFHLGITDVYEHLFIPIDSHFISITALTEWLNIPCSDKSTHQRLRTKIKQLKMMETKALLEADRIMFR